MERFVKGDVVIVEFPFSDLSSNKKRPAIVISPIAGSEYLLCQITSRTYASNEEIPLKLNDFIKGRISRDSFVRYTKLFTSKNTLIHYQAGKLKQEKVKEITDKISSFIS
ncbi:MAG: type II toxin-antitoxin system PemK/MazF family toxin [Nanoarchaeota archaeon]|mgnify:CR=1 FL=1